MTPYSLDSSRTRLRQREKIKAFTLSTALFSFLVSIFSVLSG